ncbi:hypothetical protein AOLI_G00093300 [Acnodon oligacanthus]
MNIYRDSGPLSQPLPPVHLRLPLHNGHASPAEPSLSRVSVPKMGVRARIADWPPRRERSRESLLENGNSESGSNGEVGLNRGAVAYMRRSKDAEFLDGRSLRDIPGSPSRFRMPGFAPLRQRSSSEITLSEQDEGEVESRLLFREYGSTSSIDVQAVPEESFFDMLSQFQQERRLDQRSAAPARLGELLRGQTSPEASRASPEVAFTSSRPEDRPESRVRKKSGGTESSLGTSSLFRKLRGANRGDVEASRGDVEDMGRPLDTSSLKPWLCVRSFAHYDAQSILFDLHEAAAQRSSAAQRRNTATGASAASSATAVSLAVSRALALGGAEPSFSSMDDLSCRDLTEGSSASGPDVPDPISLSSGPQQQLLLSCPNFLNETGSYGERNVSFLSSWAERGELGGAEARLRPRCSNASISVLEVEPEEQATRLERLQQHGIEHVDLGARYYRKHFHGKEHWNYFGSDEKLGPVALSIRREKLDDTKDLKDQYQYRIIFRTSELVTLRGAVLEDAVPSTTRHGTVRGLPLKEVLEYVLPELSVSCLRLALSTPKVTEQLLKLDEQGLSQKHKVGILLCRADQSTEEEMYNNEEATPAFTEFLQLLGDTVCLRGFSKYAAQLDTKTDSTGTHSLYTTYQDYEIMFHVSTMLPYMPNNPQQLLRKRHIGNDIVTIIFQEPGALPFTPQNIRSHFQHVFVIVRVHNPCSENTCYSVAVTRMKDVPPFGPPLPPSSATFRDPAAFRSFLLAKIINAENAAHKSEKFHAMATRTRQGYLRDLAENCVSSTPLDTAGKLNNLISLASKRRERVRAREGAELGALGGISWRVVAQDFSGGGAELPCILAISAEFVVLADCSTKEVVFNCFCADVIGWTAERLALKIYYGRGDHVALRVPEGGAQDIREVVQRLKLYDGFDLYRSCLGLRGCTEEFEMKTVEQKGDAEPMAAGYRSSRAPAWRWDSPPTHSAPSAQRWTPVGPPPAPSRSHKAMVPIPYREPQHIPSKRPVSYPENHYSVSPVGGDRGQYRNPSASFSSPGSALSPALGVPGLSGPFIRYKPSPDRFGSTPRSLQPYEAHLTLDVSSGDSSSGFTSQDSTMERSKTEPMWHVPASSRSVSAGAAQRRQTRQDIQGKDSPNRHSKVDMNSKNVFGQPRLRASLRDLRSPRRPAHKSTIEDDLKKLIIMDNPVDAPQQDSSPRRTLQRTFSDESLCSGRRDASYASTPLFDGQTPPGDLLFTCTLPTRRHGTNHGALLPSKKVPLSASEVSLTEVRDKVPPLRRLDPGLMPLPDTAAGLEWSSLVNAAKAYEEGCFGPQLTSDPEPQVQTEASSLVQRAVSLFSLSEPHGGAELRPVISPVHFHTPQTPRTTPTFSSDELPGDLSGRLYHLEVMLKQLNNDLEKEKQDKVALLAEMAHLRENNQRLQEESHSASEQLRKFSQLLSSNTDRK